MQSAQPAVFARDDTFLGVCEALGQDFGFNPIWLRIALGVGLLWNPLAVIAGYLAAGLIVGFSRLLVREPHQPTVEWRPDASPEGSRPAENNDDADLAVAA